MASGKSRESRFCVSRWKVTKVPRDSWVGYKREWNRKVRRDGRRACRGYYRRNHIMFSGYPLVEMSMEEVVYNRRPYVD